MVAYELKSNTSVTSRGEGQVDRDNAHLQRMGKRPVLKVCNTGFKVTHLTILLTLPTSENSVFCRSSASAVLFWELGKVCLGEPVQL